MASTHSLPNPLCLPLLRLVLAALVLVLSVPPTIAQGARSSRAAHERGASAPATPPAVVHTRGGAAVYTSRAAFEADCPGLPTETFEEADVPPNAGIVMPAPLDASTNHFPFMPGDILPGVAVTVQPFGSPNNDLFVSGQGFLGAPSVQVGTNFILDLVVELDPAVECAGLDYDLNNFGRPTEIQAFDASGNLLASALSGGGFAVQFFGVRSSGAPVARIVFGASDAGEYVDVDNIAFGDSGCEVDLTATVDDDTPAPGQTLTFTVTASNTGGAPAALDLWIEVERGGNEVLRRRLASGTLPAGATVTQPVRLRVPGNAPSGSYTAVLNIGDFGGDEVCDAVGFEITVSTSPSGTTAGAATAFEVDGPAGNFGAEARTGEEALAVEVAPNPFSGATTIRYDVAEAGPVRLDVYDLLGRKVASLVDGTMEAGAHAAAFEAAGLPGGTYLVRLDTAGGVATQRLTLLR